MPCSSGSTRGPCAEPSGRVADGAEVKSDCARALENSSAPRSKRPRQQNARIHLVDLRATAKGHRDVEFLVDDLQRARHAGFAEGAHPLEEAAADQRAAGPD